uniref:Uncharacterized protein n=1 Tax=Clytia hemisphaerica TaxID=252671 RepID=A0A7M5XCU7_9CNID|eukprot:TCONS_00050932-protein
MPPFAIYLLISHALLHLHYAQPTKADIDGKDNEKHVTANPKETLENSVIPLLEEEEKEEIGAQNPTNAQQNAQRKHRQVIIKRVKLAALAKDIPTAKEGELDCEMILSEECFGELCFRGMCTERCIPVERKVCKD